MLLSPASPVACHWLRGGESVHAVRAKGGNASLNSWPRFALDLAQELRASPGRIALLVGGGSRGLLDDISAATSMDIVAVSRRVLQDPVPQTADELLNRLLGSHLLTDIEPLFWQPWLALDPVGVLRRLARRDGPVIAEWPGRIVGRRGSYSGPGRADFYDAELTDVLVLRLQLRSFPDDLPFTVERVSA
jgi:hypothetical protein